MPRRCVVATGYIRDGKFRPSRNEAFVRAMAQMPNAPVLVRVEERKDPRSDALNAYYWAACIRHISDATGWFEREAHEEMKKLHLSPSLTALRGDGTVVDGDIVGGTTRYLSNEEMSDFVFGVHHWAVSGPLGLYIPDPTSANVVSTN